MNQIPVFAGLFLVLGVIALGLSMIFVQSNARTGFYWSERAVMYQQQGQKEHAEIAMTKALQHDPYNPLYWMQMVMLHKQEMDLADNQERKISTHESGLVLLHEQAAQILKIVHPDETINIRHQGEASSDNLRGSEHGE